MSDVCQSCTGVSRLSIIGPAYFRFNFLVSTAGTSETGGGRGVGQGGDGGQTLGGFRR